MEKAEAMRNRPSYRDNNIGLTVAIDESIAKGDEHGIQIINTEPNLIDVDGKFEAFIQYPNPFEGDIMSMVRSERKEMFNKADRLKTFNATALNSIHQPSTSEGVEMFASLSATSDQVIFASDEVLEGGLYKELIQARNQAIHWSSNFMKAIATYG